jgi:hypothetical protein
MFKPLYQAYLRAGYRWRAAGTTGAVRAVFRPLDDASPLNLIQMQG